MKKITALILLLVISLSLCACGAAKEAPFEPDLDALYEKILADTGTADMAALSDKKIYNYIGIDNADYSKAIIALCGDSVLADEIWLVQAVNADAAARIIAVANDRLAYKADELENYLPDQYEIVKQAVVLQRDNVVAVFVSPKAQDMKAIFEAA